MRCGKGEVAPVCIRSPIGAFGRPAARLQSRLVGIGIGYRITLWQRFRYHRAVPLEDGRAAAPQAAPADAGSRLTGYSSA